MPQHPVVLITGSSGFLGQAMAARLVRRYQVVGLDTVQPKQPLEGVETALVDLTSDDNVPDALAGIRRRFGAQVASVIHLAAYYDLSGEPNPKYRSVTVEGTRRLLRALQHGFDNVEQFVFASTMLVHAPTRPGGRSLRTGRSNPSGRTRSRRSRRNSWSGPNTVRSRS